MQCQLFTQHLWHVWPTYRSWTWLASNINLARPEGY